MPGSYQLPVIRPAPDGEVLDTSGRQTRLREVIEGHLTVLSFIFTHCADPGGCPLAAFVMRQVGRRAAAALESSGGVRLVSLSFDPARDSPARMREYAESLNIGTLDWQFLTTRSAAELDPLLRTYGQSVLEDPAGGAYSHQLRVFLIDRQGRIRNEYGTSFLRADTLLADLQTLHGETAVETPGNSPMPVTAVNGAGDDRSNYATKDYRSRSRALPGRPGSTLDLRGLMAEPPLGLPERTSGPLPTTAQIALGRRLFSERRLSHNNTLSCASCHLPDQGFTHQELRTPVGLEGRTVKRNAPSLYNVAYASRLFHDAREFSLEHQIWAPLLAFNEMANPSIGYVLEKLARTDDYAQRFDEAFPGQGLNLVTLGRALAAYQRGLLSANSPFDRWRYGGDAHAMSAAAKRGFELFNGKAACAQCHLVGPGSALFTDQHLHNTGVGYLRSMQTTVLGAVPVGPGQTLELAENVVAASSETPPNDLGRYEVTLRAEDRWKFRTPSLRNVAVTAPYMHDGSLSTLEEVVAFYAGGGIANEGLAPALRPLSLSEQEQADLVTFLEALTGDNLEALARDAISSPGGG